MISKLRLEHNCVDDSIIELMGWKMCDSHKMVVENKFKWVEGNFALTKTKLLDHMLWANLVTTVAFHIQYTTRTKYIEYRQLKRALLSRAIKLVSLISQSNLH